MIKGQIIIKLSDGSIIPYANKFLAPKEGDDGLKPISNLKFPGFAGISYYYTGQGNDTYEKQIEPGMIKADYEFLISQMDTLTEQGVLIFPENANGATAKPEGVPKKENGTDVLVREMMTTINTGLTFSRVKVFLNEIVSINIAEDWVDYPYGRESGYQLPKTSPNFYGFAEGKEMNAKGVDKGPDFNKYWTTDNGYIPRPILELDDKNNLIIKNESEFTKVVTEKFSEGYKAYGVREIKDEFGNVTKRKNSGEVVIYNHPIYHVMTKDTNNPKVGIKNSSVKILEGAEINYRPLLDDKGKYKFIKWAGDTTGNIEAPKIMGTEDITVYAQWEEIKYTVTKNLNYEGAADPEVISVAVDKKITYGTPLREGYKFLKWTTDQKGKNNAPKTMGTKDIIVYAQWEEIPKQPEPTVKTTKNTAPKSEAIKE